MSGTVNSRSDPRLAVDAFVKLKTGGTETEYVFRTRDLSRNGFFLYTRVPHTYPLTIGASVTLELYDYDSSITCRCVVARVVTEGSAESSTYPVGFGLKIRRHRRRQPRALRQPARAPAADRLGVLGEVGRSRPLQNLGDDRVELGRARRRRDAAREHEPRLDHLEAQGEGRHHGRRGGGAETRRGLALELHERATDEGAEVRDVEGDGGTEERAPPAEEADERTAATGHQAHLRGQILEALLSREAEIQGGELGEVLRAHGGDLEATGRVEARRRARARSSRATTSTTAKLRPA